MTTKDLIKILQKEDPEGNAHVRIGGGAIYYVDIKEGYYDGPFQYLENAEVDGKVVTRLVFSSKGYKVDINTYDLESLVWDCCGVEEEIWKRIRFEYTYTNKEPRIKQVQEDVARMAHEAREYFKNSNKEWEEKVINEYVNTGAKIVQMKRFELPTYNVQFVFKNSEEIPEPNPNRWDGWGPLAKKLCQGESRVLMESGLFRFKQGNKRNYWIYDPKNGQVYGSRFEFIDGRYLNELS